MAGPVSFKFFLGENITTNFDIHRNTYYKVTLQLKDYVITEDGHSVDSDGNFTINNSDVSWRVDSRLADIAIISGDANINASGDFFYLKLAGSTDVDWELTAEITDGVEFLWAYGKPEHGAAQWGSLVNSPVTGHGIPEGGIPIYIGPIQSGSKSPESTIVILKVNGKEVDRVTITRHPPIDINIGNGKHLWVDKVDRTALPWGFSGTTFDSNYGVVDNERYYNSDAEMITETFLDNTQYKSRAETYLPLGMGDDGSAMVYAMCLFNNTEQPHEDRETGNIIESALPPLNIGMVGGDYIGYSWREPYGKYRWTLPSIEQWEVIKEHRSDIGSDFPIYPFINYWTANAVTSANDGNGSTHSYVYSFNNGTQPYSRSTQVRFRCVAVTNQAWGW